MMNDPKFPENKESSEQPGIDTKPVAPEAEDPHAEQKQAERLKTERTYQRLFAEGKGLSDAQKKAIHDAMHSADRCRSWALLAKDTETDYLVGAKRTAGGDLEIVVCIEETGENGKKWVDMASDVVVLPTDLKISADLAPVWKDYLFTPMFD